MTHNKLKTTIMFLLTAAVLCSCRGPQGKAEKTIRKFLDENLVSQDYSVDFGKLDSTRLVTDTAVNIMRLDISKNKVFKKGIRYAPTEEKYMFMPTKVCVGKDTTRHTFYFNRDLTDIVSFK